jgi:hypothetical protein
MIQERRANIYNQQAKGTEAIIKGVSRPVSGGSSGWEARANWRSSRESSRWILRSFPKTGNRPVYSYSWNNLKVVSMPSTSPSWRKRLDRYPSGWTFNLPARLSELGRTRAGKASGHRDHVLRCSRRRPRIGWEKPSRRKTDE